ncbi:MAG: DUF3109 family protein [Odoribacter sp.]|nr:DUF3109 family protein [Odoribacter sp.]
MIQIDDTIVSFDVFLEKFCCDLSCCKGICCVEGDAGAPLAEDEPDRIKENYAGIMPFMKPEGVEAVREQGYAVIDREGDLVTSLICGRECAYAIEENNVCWCAIEKAWSEGKSDFRKPQSCYLYPIRITRYEGFEVLNYHRWSICREACLRGEREGIPVYRFLKEALVERYGEEWYAQLEYAAREIEEGRIEVPRRR